ncbi:MAG: ABC transporter ATP-binding protein [Clostridia bacterium]|nr:ABC transporter ATP-binding protein [Clostridia bacterium]MBO7657736.1 ABC transporter ATP-binding protein [Clostridia bacterium]
MQLITCSKLTIGYEGRKVLSGIDFTVCEGDYLCILGDNGSGKTTLMKTVLGLIPPISGSITFAGGVSPKQIGYMPQQDVVQRDFPASVKEIVLSGNLGRMGARPFYGKEEKKRAADALAKLGISALTNRCYRELSGGQQQRVLLARALCATEKILLLDEPTAGLDPQATVELYKTLAALNHEHGITIIMISHDLAAAKTYASHILHVGDKVFFGTTSMFAVSEFGKGGFGNA